MNATKPTYEQLEKLYEEKCRECKELRAEIAELRASTSIVVSFVGLRVLFGCDVDCRARRRRKNIAFTAFGVQTKRSSTRDKRPRAPNVLSRISTKR